MTEQINVCKFISNVMLDVQIIVFNGNVYLEGVIFRGKDDQANFSELISTSSEPI